MIPPYPRRNPFLKGESTESSTNPFAEEDDFEDEEEEDGQHGAKRKTKKTTLAAGNISKKNDLPYKKFEKKPGPGFMHHRFHAKAKSPLNAPATQGEGG